MPYSDPKRHCANVCRLARLKREAWLNEKGPCRHCGSGNNLEVDHINPKEKISHNVWTWSEKKRNFELQKCQVLCESCHKKKTREDQIAQALMDGKTILCPRKPHWRKPSDFDVSQSGQRYKYCKCCRNRGIRQARRTRKKRALNGRCMGCGDDPQNGRVHCHKCQEVNTRNKKRRQQYLTHVVVVV